MKCPMCGSELKTDWGNPVNKCPCGWGSPRPVKRSAESGFEGSEPAGGSLFVFLWILTLGMTIGPYWAMAHYHGEELSASNPRWPLWYVGAWLVYLLVCFVMRQPAIDDVKTTDMVFDNPLSINDDIRRNKFQAAVIMIPGKLIAYTLYSTWKMFR
ncbi:MAG: hypothetical protein ABFD69_01545 [Candidatus Sumerlaeia bacterium]